MIWDFIRDFLVEYIFGGHTSTGDEFGGLIGPTTYFQNGAYQDRFDTFCYDFDVMVSSLGDGNSTAIPLGDWLSTTATIIIMCAIVFAFALLVRWVFKTVTSAFLLR